MKRLLFILFLFPVIGFSQIYGPDTKYGTEHNRSNSLLALGIPRDTFPVPSSKQNYPHIAAKGVNLYLWDTTLLKWGLYSSGSSLSNIGSGYRWAVPGTGNVKTMFVVSPLVADSTSNANALTVAINGLSGFGSTGQLVRSTGSAWEYFTPTYILPGDTASMLANYWHWLAGYLTNITGLISAGANIGISGSGTAGSPYVISSSSGGMTNPMTTTGDIIYSSDNSGTPARLAAGTSTHVLTSNGAGTAPSWQAATGGGSDSIALYGRARVDSATGNDVTAVVGNPAKPFATINAALDALASYYKARIDIGLGTYSKIDSSKIRGNLVIYGSGMPMLDNNDTSNTLVNLKITEPTKLVGGTVIKGRLSVRNMPNNVEIAYCGFDNGSAYVALGNPKGDCIDFRHSGTATGATPPFPLMKGLYFHDLVCLGDTSNSLYHALTIENAIDPVVKNVLLVGNTHGLAVKTVGGIYDGIHSYWHTSDGIILKINNYSPSHEMILTNYNIRSLSEVARESGGLVIQNETGVAVQVNYNISKGNIRFTSEGIRDYADAVYYGVNISDNIIHKTTNSGIYLTGFSKGKITNCQIDSTGGNGIWITAPTVGGNIISNNHVFGQTTYAGIDIIGGTNKSYLFSNVFVNNAGNGIAASDANVYGENNVSTGNGTNFAGTLNLVLDNPLAGTGNRLIGVDANGLRYRTTVDPASLASGWPLTAITGAGTEVIGTSNAQPFTVVTNNITRMSVTSGGFFAFNPGAANGYQYEFAAYSDPDFVKIGYGNVAYSGVTIGSNSTSIVVPRLFLQGYDDTAPLLDMGNGSTSTIRFFRYSSNGVGMKTTNLSNIPFTFGGGYAFKSNTRFGDSVLTTATTSYVDLAAGTTSTSPLGFTTGPVISTPLAGKMEYTTPQLFFTNGSAIRQEIPQIQQTMVVTQFDKTSNTTLGNVTNLTADLAAGKTYRFEARLYTSSGSSGGVKAAIGGTATATTIVYEGLTTDAGTTTQSRATALGTAVGAVTAVTAGYIVITGSITTDAAGTLTVQFAQNASDAATSSVLWGSTFVVTQINY